MAARWAQLRTGQAARTRCGSRRAFPARPRVGILGEAPRPPRNPNRIPEYEAAPGSHQVAPARAAGRSRAPLQASNRCAAEPCGRAGAATAATSIPTVVPGGRRVKAQARARGRRLRIALRTPPATSRALYGQPAALDCRQPEDPARRTSRQPAFRSRITTLSLPR